MACDITAQVKATVDATGAIQGAGGGGGVGLQIAIPATTKRVHAFGAAPAGLRLVDRLTLNSRRDGPQAMNGVLPIPNGNLNVNLNVTAVMEHKLRLYADCNAPWCTEGIALRQKLQVELWSIAAIPMLVQPFQISGTTLTFGREQLTWGPCFTPPWRNCCPATQTKTFTFAATKVTILRNLLELRLSGSVDVQYQIYNRPAPMVKGKRRGRRTTRPSRKAG